MQKIYDTGKIPLIIRLPVLVMGFFFLWFAANIAALHLFGINLGFGLGKEKGSPLIASVILIVLGLIFISIWFARNRFFYDAAVQGIVVQHSGLLYRSNRRIPLTNATGVYLKPGRIRATEFWNIGLQFKDNKQVWLTRINDSAEAETIAESFSNITRLPVLK